jgi:hypothetical protein
MRNNHLGLSYRDVVTDVVKSFNRAMRPLIGCNVARLKGDRIAFANGHTYTMSKGCKLMIRYARKCHRHYFDDNSLRKKFHDVLYHQWYFERKAMECAEAVRYESMRPCIQRKQSGRGLMMDLERIRCKKRMRTEY